MSTLVKNKISKDNAPSLTIVVPCYNESEVFLTSLDVLRSLLLKEIKAQSIAQDSKILFVDDGSTDDTWSQIESACQNSSHIAGLKLSRNRGHQVALLAGLHAVDTEISISIDADLQDDTAAIPKMIQEYKNGNEIVYGVRNDRKTDSIFKSLTAGLYYGLMKRMVPGMIPQHADFRLLGPSSLSALKTYSVKNLYLRGIIPELGFKSSKVEYQRLKRQAGVSHYPLLKMLQLAWAGITSQTILPLKFITFIGGLSLLIAVLGFAYTLFSWVYWNTVTGWTSLEMTIIFFGSVQLFSLGILGEYLAKTNLEATSKPLYFVEQFYPSTSKPTEK